MKTAELLKAIENLKLTLESSFYLDTKIKITDSKVEVLIKIDNLPR